jgi:hypothetical protein
MENPGAGDSFNDYLAARGHPELCYRGRPEASLFERVAQALKLGLDYGLIVRLWTVWRAQ